MNRILRIPILLLAVLALLTLAGCVPVPIPLSSNGLVIGKSYHLASRETLNNDLTVFGGNATLDQNSTVNGDVSVFGGDVTIDGAVNGDLSVIGGIVKLNEHANVKGSVNSVGGTIQQANGAVVQGQNLGNNHPTPRITTLHTPMMQVGFDPITGPLMAIFQALALAALAIVVFLFAPRPLERAGIAAVTQPAASGGVGCLTILVLIVMSITIILLPISLLGFIAVGIAALFGLLALGLLVGRRIAVWLKQPWSDPINAGAGTLVLSLLISLLNVIPCIGWTAGFIVGLVALGAVILTRFGTQTYPGPYAAAPVSRPGPYAPPPPPPSASVYGPESDRPRQNPPSGPQGDNPA